MNTLFTHQNASCLMTIGKHTAFENRNVWSISVSVNQEANALVVKRPTVHYSVNALTSETRWHPNSFKICKKWVKFHNYWMLSQLTHSNKTKHNSALNHYHRLCYMQAHHHHHYIVLRLAFTWGCMWHRQPQSRIQFHNQPLLHAIKNRKKIKISKDDFTCT